MDLLHTLEIQCDTDSAKHSRQWIAQIMANAVRKLIKLFIGFLKLHIAHIQQRVRYIELIGLLNTRNNLSLLPWFFDKPEDMASVNGVNNRIHIGKSSDQDPHLCRDLLIVPADESNRSFIGDLIVTKNHSEIGIGH